MNGVERFNKVHSVWNVLKFTYGLVCIIAGADKFFNIITRWGQYVHPAIGQMLPISLVQFLYVVGIIEIIAGILILTKYTKIGAYIVMAWLLIIVVNLLAMGLFFDIAVRDFVMAVGAWALAQLTGL